MSRGGPSHLKKGPGDYKVSWDHQWQKVSGCRKSAWEVRSKGAGRWGDWSRGKRGSCKRNGIDLVK